MQDYHLRLSSWEMLRNPKTKYTCAPCICRSVWPHAHAHSRRRRCGLQLHTVHVICEVSSLPTSLVLSFLLLLASITQHTCTCTHVYNLHMGTWMCMSVAFFSTFCAYAKSEMSVQVTVKTLKSEYLEKIRIFASPVLTLLTALCYSSVLHRISSKLPFLNE